MELFQGGPNALMGRLQLLEIGEQSDELDDTIFDQIVASTPASAPLLDLSLWNSLLFIEVCARSLAPALAELLCLQTLYLCGNEIGDGATDVLTSLATRPPCLKYLDFSSNSLLPTALPPLTAFLNGTGAGCLETLQLDYINMMFESN